jgi:prepilin-type N-terminal cleavage/methylation domain-containing protein
VVAAVSAALQRIHEQKETKIVGLVRTNRSLFSASSPITNHYPLSHLSPNPPKDGFAVANNRSLITDNRVNAPRAFTLIELLVVIIMIAILAGLLFPALIGTQNQAKKVQAKNDVTQIVSAVNAFYTEYGKYPVDSTASGYVPADTYYGSGTAPTGITVSYTNDKLIDVLRNNTSSTSTANGGGNLVTTLNPRGIVFIALPSVRNQSQPKSGIATLTVTVNGISIPIGSFVDPYGTPYSVAIDGSYDNQISNPYGAPATGGAGTNPLFQGAIAWSFGSDQKLGTNGDKIYRTSGGAQSDDVISWQ